MTADQLEQTITALKNRKDAELAWEIADMVLTERLSVKRFERLQDVLPGERSKQALLILKDQSKFLAPPASEIPSTSEPSIAEQKRILSLTVVYVRDAIPQLPNFVSTRETSRFEDTPLLQFPGRFFTPYEPLHFVGTTSETVVYRAGNEVIEASATPKNATPAPAGLINSGVFGPMLARVLVDAAQSELAWNRWEQGEGGLEAVFRFAVPREKSHYEVNYCCIAEESATRAANIHSFRQIAGYHGEIAIDPSQGTVMRILVHADLKPTAPVVRSAILIEYGPVEIGGKSYICPTKSISQVVAQTYQLDSNFKFPVANQSQPLRTLLNEVRFKEYHVFRSESRVLTADEANGAPSKTAAGTAPKVAGETVSGNNEEAQEVAPDLTATKPIEAAIASAPAKPEPANAPAAATATADASEPEMREIETTGIPDLPPKTAGAESGFTLRKVSRLVDVAVVAYDKKDQPIRDLRQSNFEIYDNGHRQQVQFFSQPEAGPGTPATAEEQSHTPEAMPQVFTNGAPTLEGTHPAIQRPEYDTTILLIDASNLAFGDMTYAREEMLRFLKTTHADERVGLYVMRSYDFQILMEPTTDHAAVASTLSKWMPSAQDLGRAQDEEVRNRRHIDWVIHASDLAYVNGNEESDPHQSYSGTGAAGAEANTVDPQLRLMGSNPQRDAIQNLRTIARHLAAIPGHKSLIWVSSDNVLADWSSQAAGREDKGSNFVDPLAVHAREALNEAGVSIYPLDASQLEAGVISADLANRLVQSKFPPRPGEPPPPPPNPTGRYASEMHQDTHAIAGTFRDLAEATGGRALRRSSDIAAELNGIVADGRAVYFLSFSPDTAADDTYHHLMVRVAGRKDVSVRFRSGYLYSKEPTTFKGKLNQAIWGPAEMNEIGISATPESRPNGVALKLRIAATDLALSEQNGRWADKIDIIVVERDDSALQANVRARTWAMRLMPATYEKALRDGIIVDEAVSSAQEDRVVRAVVVDENSGRMGTVSVPASAMRETQ